LTSRMRLGPLVALGVLVPALAATASDWPRFRGPNGTGVSADAGLPAELGRDRATWSAKLPKGNSSPIVVGGRLYLTGHDGDERITLCYDAANGALLWKRSLPRARVESFHALNGPTTPTPATDGQRVFVFFPEIGLVAYDRDGREQWKTPLGPFRSIQGMAASPVYVDGTVALLVDTAEEAYLAAFDAATGTSLWKTDRPRGVLGGYATPTVDARPGRPSEIVVAGAVELTGYDAATGKRLWWAPGVTGYPTGPPFVAGDSVYTMEPLGVEWPAWSVPLGLFDRDHDGRIAIDDAASDASWKGSLAGIDANVGNRDGFVTREEYEKATGGQSGGLVRTRLGGRGDVSKTHVVWRHEKGLPQLTGALLYDGVLYVVRNGIVSTFDPDTGKLLRRERIENAIGDYYASPIAGDGKVYVASLDGKIAVLRAGADWRVLSVSDLGEPIVATPAIADGHVFVRTEAALYCFGGRPRPVTRRPRADARPRALA
jgi:outer membrane protein assembly factor BamB